MSLSYWKITNHSADLKEFVYTSGSSAPGTGFTINVSGNSFEIVESFTEPENLALGIGEETFLNDSFFPGPGYAWWWNNGNKVNYIKINHQSANNENIGPYINNTNILSFLVVGALDSSGNYLIGETSQSMEDFVLSNSIQKPQGYNLLNIDQDDPQTTFAVEALNGTFANFNFSASGNYLWHATASGRSDEPISSSAYTESIAQGYFPINIDDFGQEQFFRGWASANYYVQDDLLEVEGEEIDFLNHFNTGSTERDNDYFNPYQVSKLPWFINAPSSSFLIQSESFNSYTSQNRIVQIGPRFTYTTPKAIYDGTSYYEDSEYNGTGDEGDLIYFYKEDTNEILIQDPDNILNDPKSNILQLNSSRNAPLIGLNSPQTYITVEGHEFEIKSENELWVYRGNQPAGTGDTNAWNYNRYLHRPYKIYMITTTGSNGLPSHFEKVYVSFSSSLASERRTDGAYIFSADVGGQDLEFTASVNLTSSRPFPVGGYETASYNNYDEYEQTPNPSPTTSTWETASLRLYLGSLNDNGFVYESQSIYIDDINSDNSIELHSVLSSSYIEVGSALRLALFVDSGSQTREVNSSLLVTDYSMKISASTPQGTDLVPTYLDNILQVSEDCDPIVGNAINSNPHNILMKVDYSTDALNPINFDQIIDNKATKANIPLSNYTQLPHIKSRYIGTRSETRFLNFFTEGDSGTYGKIPNISQNKAYSAYFNRIYDTYPLLNNKTALEVKYVIDENGNATQPRISDYTYYNLEGSLSDQEIAKISVSDKESEVLYELNGFKQIFKTGKKPVPILYSQISANQYTSSLFVLGKTAISNEPSTFNDYTVVASSETSATTALNISNQQLLPNQSIFTGSAINFTASYDSANGRRFFPTTDDKGVNGAGSNKPLSDAYDYIVENSIETSYVTKVKTQNGQSSSWSQPFGQSTEYSTSVGNIKNYTEKNGSKAKIELISLTCEAIYSNASSATGEVSKTFDVETYMNQAIGYEESNKVIVLQLNSDWVRQAFEANGYSTSDWRSGGTLRRLRWNFKYRVLQEGSGATEFKQGDSFKSYYSGECRQASDYNGGSNLTYQTQFYPTANGAFTSNQFIKITSQAASAAPTDAFEAPYWVWPTGSGGEIENFSVIELVPLNANLTYGRETFRQAFTPYNNGPEPYYPTGSDGGSDTLSPSSSLTPYFPSGREPKFVRFPQVKNDWKIYPGDEFRFMNNEDLTYTVTNVVEPSLTSTGLSIADGKLLATTDALLNSVISHPVGAISGNYTGITLFADTGSGANNAIADIELDSPTNISSITVTTTGSGYSPGDIITIPSSSLGADAPGGVDAKIELQANDFYGDPSEAGTGVRVYFDREINSQVDLDFFLIRRYVVDEGTILINYAKPYEVPEEQRTATGLIFPRFPVKELSTNPDVVLKNLLEQKLIE